MFNVVLMQSYISCICCTSIRNTDIFGQSWIKNRRQGISTISGYFGQRFKSEIKLVLIIKIEKNFRKSTKKTKKTLQSLSVTQNLFHGYYIHKISCN